MQIKAAIAVLALALTAAANPVPDKAAQEAASKCGNNQKLMCCQSVTKQILNLIPINIGSGCTPIDIVSLVSLNQQCTTQVACCESNQVGLINVGNVCPIVL